MSPRPTPESRPHRTGLLAVAGAVQFVVSIALLLVASAAPDRLPRWGGPVDGAVAFSLIGTLALLHHAAAERVGVEALRASHRVATAIVPVVFVLLWVFRDRLVWNTLLPGLAWRTFVLPSAVPLCLAARRR